MASLTKFEQFSEDLAKGVHNLSSNQLVVALSNAANPPSASLDAVLGDFTQIAYTNLSSRNVTTTSCEQTSGTTKLILQDLVLTASGDVAAFRYVILYNDTPAGPVDPLIGFYDYTSEVTLHNGDTFTVDWDQVNGAIQIA